MNITGKVQKIWFFLDQDSLVHSFEKGTGTFIFSIEVGHVAGAYPAHELNYSAGGVLANHKVKVIGHQTVGQKLNFLPQVHILAAPDAVGGLGFERGERVRFDGG